MNWKPWIHSIVAAAIGGSASALGAVLVSPASFTFTQSGIEHLGSVALAGAVIPVLALLKRSPLPSGPSGGDPPPPPGPIATLALKEKP